jgi:hypothetical protein
MQLRFKITIAVSILVVLLMITVAFLCSFVSKNS